MALGYSDLFNYGGTPTLDTERSVSMPFFNNMDPHDQRTFNKVVKTRQVVNMDDQGGDSGRASAFDSLMRGYDAKTTELTDKLRSIYDSYDGYAAEFGDDIKPIMDAIGGDIDQLKDWMGGYDELLAEMKPGMMNGIDVENSAAGRRAEYMGNVAGQYGAAEDTMRRNMISQGLNPNSNTGATRDFRLQRAGALAGAANQAHTDYREAHNRDMGLQNDSRAQFAGLYSKQADNLNNIMQARGGLAGIHKSIYDTRLDAQKAKAAGYEGLTGLNENRRSEALQLEQANAKQRQANLNARTELQAGLGSAGQWKTVY
ncbi:MAG: hypothetical protein KDC43_30075 [Saprospiraceae bacterium]|mgnify:CR=1 FL=1|nr:hypothetical protein [Saprospiraceae bacterium]